MKIAIIGFGREGHAAYDYWKNGNDITICDQNEAVTVPTGVNAQLGTDYLQGLNQFDLIIRSPFVHPRLLVESAGPKILGKVTTNANELLKVCPTRNVIGVTGTKGKGTTSTLIAEMLKSAGHTVHLGGNIGLAPLELLKDNITSNDWVVLELSSYQLIDLKYSPLIAVCLMVVPEHLDWHEDFEEYVAAKQQLFIHQGENDIAIFYADNPDSVSIADGSEGKLIPYYTAPGAWVDGTKIVMDDQEICQVTDLKLLGEHNWQNVCAAVTAVWQVTQDVMALREVLTSFVGLPFRIEPRGEKNGVRYYNDSFATGPHAPIPAIDAITGQLVPIMGGFDRGLDLSDFAKEIKHREGRIRKLLIIGQSGKRFSEELQKQGFTNFAFASGTTMDAIVKEASALAESGDAVLLSPGFASFDMFKDFEDRGRQFNAAVEAL